MGMELLAVFTGPEPLTPETAWRPIVSASKAPATEPH